MNTAAATRLALDILTIAREVVPAKRSGSIEIRALAYFRRQNGGLLGRERCDEIKLAAAEFERISRVSATHNASRAWNYAMAGQPEQWIGEFVRDVAAA